MLAKNLLIPFALAAMAMGNPLEKRWAPVGQSCTNSNNQPGTVYNCPSTAIGILDGVLSCSKLPIKNFLETLCSLPEPVLDQNNIQVQACCVVVALGGYCQS